MDPPATAAQVAEISTKLDVLLTQHTMVASQVMDHEQRLRVVETKQTSTDARVNDLTKRDDDQEVRLRAADRWRYAMPLAGITGLGAVLTGAAALITALQGG
ncbi:hypothetical protein AB0K34_10955 [Actinomadura sp. NPDC049382]|uniref:hypothetical protein n=1 Tax=Actinomadura sp. NPDC049382 TaxID=3158220 RepID=UPI00344212B1